MKFNFLFFVTTITGILILTGCNDTNQDVDDNSGVEQDDHSEGDSTNPNNEPPSLIVLVGEETIIPEVGTYSWSTDNEDGTVGGIEADSLSPSELNLPSNHEDVSADTSIELEFDEEPQNYTVRVWDEDGDIINESSEFIIFGEGEIIYEILAQWEQGTVSYVFSLIIE